MNRERCAVCDYGVFKDIYTLDNYPITPSSNTDEACTDIFVDYTVMECMRCGCLQNKTLIDPILLYANHITSRL